MTKTTRKIIGKLHLWLGLIVGLVVFIVCITAAIWSFSPEIENATQPYRHVTPQEQPFLSVATLSDIARKQLPVRQLQRFNIRGRNESVKAEFYGEGYYDIVYLNPYTGAVLKVKDERHSFFGTVIRGHYELWMGAIGGQIVKWASLIFLVMMVSGIILWWPRNKAARKQRFSVKYNASPKRMNYDLHNVLGFYASWALLFAILTALVWTFDSLGKAEFWLGSGGKSMPAYPYPLSAKHNNLQAIPHGIDSVYQLQLSHYPAGVYQSYIQLPATDSNAYQVAIYPCNDYYHGNFTWYDQYSLREIPVSFYGQYAQANGGEKLARMNYDIHIGNILGLPGRIAMFFAALIGASLPITGFYIWWGRKRKHKQ